MGRRILLAGIPGFWNAGQSDSSREGRHHAVITDWEVGRILSAVDIWEACVRAGKVPLLASFQRHSARRVSIDPEYFAGRVPVAQHQSIRRLRIDFEIMCSRAMGMAVNEAANVGVRHVVDHGMLIDVHDAGIGFAAGMALAFRPGHPGKGFALLHGLGEEMPLPFG